MCLWGKDIAESGRVALSLLLQEQLLELILKDLQMPEMDGFKAARQHGKLADAKVAGLPILAISAASEQEAKE